MLKLHIANKNYSSWSLRPWTVLKTFNIPFTEIIHPYPADGVWHEYRKFSPSGKVPCLVDDSGGDGDLVIWDSIAIVEYLAENFPQIWPKEKKARAWARSVSAEMHSGFQALRNNCGMSCGVRVQLNGISPALQKDLDRLDELWCEGLKKFGGPFLAGSQFSAADAFFTSVAFRVQTYSLPLSPAASAYAKHLLNLPCMLEWYEAAVKETWREPAHDQDVLDAGKIIADYRAI